MFSPNTRPDANPASDQTQLDHPTTSQRLGGGWWGALTAAGAATALGIQPGCSVEMSLTWRAAEPGQAFDFSSGRFKEVYLDQVQHDHHGKDPYRGLRFE